MATEQKYTLVQHSAFACGKPQFKKAVEERAVSDKRAEKIKRAGGMIFDCWSKADDAAMEENYPPEVQGLIPCVRGTFHPTMKVDGMRVYIPAPKNAEVAR